MFVIILLSIIIVVLCVIIARLSYLYSKQKDVIEFLQILIIGLSH